MADMEMELNQSLFPHLTYFLVVEEQNREKQFYSERGLTCDPKGDHFIHFTVFVPDFQLAISA